jgi:hypothetical protein
MIHHVLNPILANVSLESVLQFILSPRNAEVYNAIVVLAMALMGLALSWACVCLTKRLTAAPSANPRKLFVQLCRAHDLSSGDRYQLEQLAKLLGMENPAILMIDASCWNVDELASAKKLTPTQRERLLTLQKVLYDQPRLTMVS